MEQDGGTDDVSRFLFCSRSFFTVGRVQHGFSFDAKVERDLVRFNIFVRFKCGCITTGGRRKRNY